MSTAYHPQTDGATERVMQEIQAYSEQKNCSNVLLLFKDSKITQELLRLKT